MSFKRKETTTTLNLNMPQTLNTYIGTNGFVIPKNELTPEQQTKIREALTVKPVIIGAPAGASVSFPVYRESGNKFYLPRYFGETHFGSPKSVKVSEGNNIQLSFNGQLRPHQIPAVEAYMNKVQGTPTGAGLLELYCAFGKTALSLYIMCALGKKTMVIVHKGFLMDQWIERIQAFVPDAKIGKIQGQTIDVEDKDIVICMLQSLIQKDYPADLFRQFGFTIIDECHHISSQTFSNALFKVVTKYMLGLSATMERKDGTTSVFKMFLGDVVYKAVREGNDHGVTVRAITFKSNDPDFNEVVLDWRGKPQVSTMISKLCNFNPRTEFIIRTLVDFITVSNVDREVVKAHKAQMDASNPCCAKCGSNSNYLMVNTCCGAVKYCMLCLDGIVEHYKTTVEVTVDKKTGEQKQTKRRPKCPECNKVLAYEQNYVENPYIKPMKDCQTIVFAKNLNLLEYIYKRFICKNIASVGYYIGGMKEAELKKSETKQVILASFDNASEGLDIPTLNAGFLITPKTDIEQVVGRVIRAKHATASPIIYDISDSHDNFVRQWYKRRAYFKAQKFRIIQTTSIDYNTNFDTWRVVNDGSTTAEEEPELGLSDSSEEDKPKLGKCMIKLKK